MSVLHPSKPIVAYAAGCMLIVYDLLSDAKIQLTSHQHEVQAIAFSPISSIASVSTASPAGYGGFDGDFLISIDFDQ